MNTPLGDTVSTDDIVGRVLQLWEADFPLAPRFPAAEVMKQMGFELEEAEAKLQEQHRPPTDEITILEKKCQAMREFLDLGRRVERRIRNEAEEDRQGRTTSTLTPVSEIHPGDVYQQPETRFLTDSAYRWVKEAYGGLEVPEWAPASRPPSTQGAQKPIMDNERTKYDAILTGLLEVVAAKVGGRYQENGKPNYTQIAEETAESLKSTGIDLPGLSATTLRKKFAAAVKSTQQYRRRENDL